MAKGRPAMCERCGGKSRRGWAIGGMVAGGAFASLAFATLGAAPSSTKVQDVVVAKEFRVVDEKSNERIVMGYRNGHSSIVVYNASQAPVVNIEDAGDGMVVVSLHSWAAAGTRSGGAILMGLGPDGAGAVSKSDAAGNFRDATFAPRKPKR